MTKKQKAYLKIFIGLLPIMGLFGWLANEHFYAFLISIFITTTMVVGMWVAVNEVMDLIEGFYDD